MPGLISEGCIWAYPREESFRKNIRFIRKNSHSFLGDSNNLRQHLENNYSINEIKNKYKNSLLKLLQDAIWQSDIINEVVEM